MKNMRTLTLMCATALFAAALTSLASCGKAPDDTSGTQRSVKIGRQQGALRAGVGMTATFKVDTENIKDGQTGRIIWYADKKGGEEASAPAGIGNAGVTDIENDSSTVTITTTDGIAEGEYYLAVEFNERWSSGVATLTVGEEAYFTIWEQTGAVSSGQSDVEISYILTVTNMDAAGKNIAVAWFTDEQGTASGGQPANVSAQGQITGNVLKFTVGSGGKTTPAGTYYFRATVDGEYPSANVGTLTVFEPFFTIGAQTGTAGNINSAQTVSYTLTGNGLDVAGKSVTVEWFADATGHSSFGTGNPSYVVVQSPTTGNVLKFTVGPCTNPNSGWGTFYFRATLNGEYTSQNVGILIVNKVI